MSKAKQLLTKLDEVDPAYHRAQAKVKSMEQDRLELKAQVADMGAKIDVARERARSLRGKKRRKR